MARDAVANVAAEAPRSLARFAAFALWLGLVGFGGGFVVAQRVRTSLVERRRWLGDDAFVESFSVASALPGTTATNLIAILGLRFHGTLGAIAGAVAFLAPSIALMMALGASYDLVRSATWLSAVLDGMSMATVGIVAAVAVHMGRAAIKRPLDGALAALACTVLALRVLSLLEVVVVAGIVGAIALRPPPRPRGEVEEPFPPGSLRALLVPPEWLGSHFPVAVDLLLVFARIGVTTFGGGFAMIPAIEHEVVASHGWLTSAAFTDAIVLGQITPGPVAIASTFIGFRVAGVVGALVATIGMFAPPLLLSIVAGHSLAAFRGNAVVQGALRGIAPAVVGIIGAAAIALGQTSMSSWPAAVIAAVSFILLVVFETMSPLLPLALGGVAAFVWRTM